MSTWIQTLDGGKFDLYRPTPAMVNFDTIAGVLARIPRFGGHTLGGIYSVAQHCVEGARALQRHNTAYTAAAFLLHDAHEAYIGDDVTPKIEALAAYMLDVGGDDRAVCAAHREMKREIDHAIYTAAGLSWPLLYDVATIVRQMDLDMLTTERMERLPPAPSPWSAKGFVLPDVDTSFWPEELAARMWRQTLRDLCGV